MTRLFLALILALTACDSTGDGLCDPTAGRGPCCDQSEITAEDCPPGWVFDFSDGGDQPPFEGCADPAPNGESFGRSPRAYQGPAATVWRAIHSQDACYSNGRARWRTQQSDDPEHPQCLVGCWDEAGAAVSRAGVCHDMRYVPDCL